MLMAMLSCGFLYFYFLEFVHCYCSCDRQKCLQSCTEQLLTTECLFFLGTKSNCTLLGIDIFEIAIRDLEYMEKDLQNYVLGMQHRSNIGGGCLQRGCPEWVSLQSKLN